jgi:hypothetical protein
VHTHIACTYTPHTLAGYTRQRVPCLANFARGDSGGGLRPGNGDGIPMTAGVAREARRVARDATERASEIRSRFSRRRECREALRATALSSLSQFVLVSSRFRRSACSSHRLRRYHDYSVTRRNKLREQKYQAHALFFSPLSPLATLPRDEGAGAKGRRGHDIARQQRARSATRRDATSRLRGLPLPRHFSLQFSRSRV